MLCAYVLSQEEKAKKLLVINMEEIFIINMRLINIRLQRVIFGRLAGCWWLV